MLQQSQSFFLIPQEKASYNTEDGKLLLQLNTLPISQYLFVSTYLKLIMLPAKVNTEILALKVLSGQS